jgi:hypothetical protein
VYTRDLGVDVGGGNSTGPGAGTGTGTDTGTGTGANGGTGVQTEVEAATKDGTAVAVVEPDVIKDLIAEAKIDGVAEVIIVITSAESSKNTEIILSADSINDLANNGMNLTLQSHAATITFDTETLKNIASENLGDATVTVTITIVDASTELNERQKAVVGDNPVIDFSVWVGDVKIHELGGTATVSVPYTPPATINSADYDLLTVYYLDENGNIREMKGAEYNAETGLITFITTHFSLFFIAEWICPFDDVAKAAWYYRSVRFVYSEDIMVGNGKGQFMPNTILTRAMIVQMLYNLEGNPSVTNGRTFNDVQSGAWYYDAVSWAGASGIVSGYGNGVFGPDDDLTREQMATILHNYSKWKGLDIYSSVWKSEFTDIDSVSAWATEAMIWANANSIINGVTLTILAPRGTADRAQAATMFKNFMENVAL